MYTFSIQKDYKKYNLASEAYAVILHAEDFNLDYKIVEQPIPGTIPIGTVEWCAPLTKGIPVDFFPKSLQKHFNRKHYELDKGPRMGIKLDDENWFVKDLSGWKTRFETGLCLKDSGLKPGHYMISEPIKMLNEWRYYVVEGEIITAEWYKGWDYNKKAPLIDFDKSVTGAIDFTVFNEKPELIEAHAPFACGWYGTKGYEYVYWQYMAWNAVMKQLEDK